MFGGFDISDNGEMSCRGRGNNQTIQLHALRSSSVGAGARYSSAGGNKENVRTSRSSSVGARAEYNSYDNSAGCVESDNAVDGEADFSDINNTSAGCVGSAGAVDGETDFSEHTTGIKSAQGLRATSGQLDPLLLAKCLRRGDMRTICLLNALHETLKRTVYANRVRLAERLASIPRPTEASHSCNGSDLRSVPEPAEAGNCGGSSVMPAASVEVPEVQTEKLLCRDGVSQTHQLCVKADEVVSRSIRAPQIQEKRCEYSDNSSGGHRPRSDVRFTEEVLTGGGSRSDRIQKRGKGNPSAKAKHKNRGKSKKAGHQTHGNAVSARAFVDRQCHSHSVSASKATRQNWGPCHSSTKSKACATNGEIKPQRHTHVKRDQIDKKSPNIDNYITSECLPVAGRAKRSSTRTVTASIRLSEAPDTTQRDHDETVSKDGNSKARFRRGDLQLSHVFSLSLMFAPEDRDGGSSNQSSAHDNTEFTKSKSHHDPHAAVSDEQRQPTSAIETPKSGTAVSAPAQGVSWIDTLVYGSQPHSSPAAAPDSNVDIPAGKLPLSQRLCQDLDDLVALDYEETDSEVESEIVTVVADSSIGGSEDLDSSPRAHSSDNNSYIRDIISGGSATRTVLKAQYPDREELKGTDRPKLSESLQNRLRAYFQGQGQQLSGRGCNEYSGGDSARSSRAVSVGSDSDSGSSQTQLSSGCETASSSETTFESHNPLHECVASPDTVSSGFNLRVSHGCRVPSAPPHLDDDEQSAQGAGDFDSSGSESDGISDPTVSTEPSPERPEKPKSGPTPMKNRTKKKKKSRKQAQAQCAVSSRRTSTSLLSTSGRANSRWAQVDPDVSEVPMPALLQTCESVKGDGAVRTATTAAEPSTTASGSAVTGGSSLSLNGNAKIHASKSNSNRLASDLKVTTAADIEFDSGVTKFSAAEVGADLDSAERSAVGAKAPQRAKRSKGAERANLNARGGRGTAIPTAILTQSSAYPVTGNRSRGKSKKEKSSGVKLEVIDGSNRSKTLASELLNAPGVSFKIPFRDIVSRTRVIGSETVNNLKSVRKWVLGSPTSGSAGLDYGRGSDGGSAGFSWGLGKVLICSSEIEKEAGWSSAGGEKEERSKKQWWL